MKNVFFRKGRATAPHTGRILTLALALVMLLSTLLACTPADPGNEPEREHVDYVAQTKLEMTSSSRKIEARVKSYIDGDTTHFYVDESADFPEGVVKARYLAIDTPESTGRLEEWGKKASAFTKETLKNAAAILLESDDEIWNKDNNGRHLLWIWYKPTADAEWRNLNIEILQNGYAIASNSGQNRYGSTCLAALAQATAEKLYVHSNEKDPSFPYGDATEITIKELRTNREAYEGVKVAVEGVIAQNTNGTLYLEQYDEEDERWYGMQVFYGYNMATSAKRFLQTGNAVRIVGTFQYAEVVNAWQIAGLEYDQMDPKNPKNTQLIAENQTVPYTEISDLSVFTNGKTDLAVGEETVSFDNNYLALHTSASLKGLTVVDYWVTERETSDDKGAITLVCEKDGVRINIRTIVLYENGALVTPDRFAGKTIDVLGVVDSYTPEGSTEAQIQVRVFTVGAITIH
jgi:endonuclease YncB( thermonuclease family)